MLRARPSRPAQRLRDVIDEARLADEVGLDVFGVGEHHRADFPISVPAVVLAAIAERTDADPSVERRQCPLVG